MSLAPWTHTKLPNLRSEGVLMKSNVSSPSASASSRRPKTIVCRVVPQSRTSSQPLLTIKAPAAQKNSRGTWTPVMAAMRPMANGMVHNTYMRGYIRNAG